MVKVDFMAFDYTNKEPVIKMDGIIKEFSGVRALNGITFDVYKGETHCLVGENGAGKSTLMKILSGAYVPTEGTITIDGKTYNSLTPRLSKELGVDIVYQENDLVPTMNAVENIFVGNEISRGGLIRFDEQLKKVRELMGRYHVEIDPMQTIEHMSVSDQQFVKILKSLSGKPKIIIMDEPTSMFNVEDAGKVLDLVRNINQDGISIIYISHFLEEVRKIADRITVIRDGMVINTYFNAERNIPFDTITRDMVGRPVDIFYTKEHNPIGDVMFEVKNLRLTHDSPEINFSVRQGEILGLSGMVGSGRTEIVRAVTGADPRFSGDIYINGKKKKINSPSDSIEAGMAHITEDRQLQGLTLNASVLENMLLVGLRNIKAPFHYNCKKFTPKISPIIDELRIKMPGIDSEVMYLSGGNQQKVVLGKWLFAKENIYIFDEPTRGIDVNSKADFYKAMTNLAKAGNCIVMVSSDLPELISMSDRVLVIRDGAVKSELSGADINEHKIIKEALGVEKK